MTSVTEVPDTVHEAFRMLKTGRPLPVEIEIAWDTLADEDDVELHEPAIYEPLVPDDGDVERAVGLPLSGRASAHLGGLGGSVCRTRAKP